MDWFFGEIFLCKKVSWKGTDKYSLDRYISIGFIEDDWFVSRIIGVGDQGGIPCLLSKLLQGCFVVYEGNHDLTGSSGTYLTYQDEISIFDSFLIHRVALSSKEKIFFRLNEHLRRYGDLCFDIFLSEYRHPASDRADEGNISNFDTIALKLWWYLDLITTISIDPSFFMICSRSTEIDRGEAYPRAAWRARIVIFSPFVRNSRIFWRANCSFMVSFSVGIKRKVNIYKVYVHIYR